jgi:hypothetical protein
MISAADNTESLVKTPFGEEKFLLVEMKKIIQKPELHLYSLATTNRKIQSPVEKPKYPKIQMKTVFNPDPIFENQQCP